MSEQPSAVSRPFTATVAPTIPHVKSRLRKGTLTYGPVGRVLWTAALVTPAGWLAHKIVAEGRFVLLDSGFALVFVVVWTGWVVPRALRDVWAKETVYVPQPMAAPTELLTDPDGRHVSTLAEYVAAQADLE